MADHVSVVRRLYEAFSQQDETVMREVLHSDVLWVQCEGFPGGGQHRGAKAVLEKVFGSLREEWAEWRVEIEEYLDAGRSVVVLGHYAVRHAVAARLATAVFAHVYDLKDGQIVRFRQFTDTHQLVKATIPSGDA